MRLRVLGCHGGEAPGYKATCFQIDGNMLVDAGAIASTLSIEKMCEIDHILLTHSHLDHVKDLAAMADLIIGRRPKPVIVYGAPQTVSTLRQHFFNNFLWPDFTAIPTMEDPVFRIETLIPGRDHRINGYQIRPIPVNHPVESMAFIIKGKGRSIAISGDTGPTDLLWKEVNRMRNLRAVLVDTSFPNFLQELADVSGHLTPQTLEEQMRKINNPERLTVMPYHLKPAFVGQMKRELGQLGRDNLRVLNLEDEFHF